MKLVNISADELDSFVYNSNKPHFQQTSAWGEVNEARGGHIHMLGLKDDEGRICGSALLIEKKILSYSTFYCPRGFITDYNNSELVSVFMSELKTYVKNHKGLYLKFDPDIIIRKLDSEANIKEEFPDRLKVIDLFKRNGATHKGFTTDFRATASPRFTFRVDLSRSEEEIFDTFHNTTKKILKDNNPHGIVISKNGEKDLEDFYEVMKETQKRKRMYMESYKFFKDFYEILHKHDMADIYTARISVDTLKTEYASRIAAVDSEIDNVSKRPDGPKKENKLKDLMAKKNKILKELDQIEAIKEEEVVLSSIITARYKDMAWTIHGGNSDKLPFLCGNYELYYEIMKDSKRMGCNWIDFYGSEGKVDKTSEIYGIFLFKLRFGGDFDEFSGEFDLITRPLTNTLIMKAIMLRRSLLYKLSLKK